MSWRNLKMVVFLSQIMDIFYDITPRNQAPIPTQSGIKLIMH